MVGFKEAAAAIVSRFDANWSTTEKVYDADDYKPAAGTNWVALQVNFQDALQTSLNGNNPKHRLIGVIEIYICTPSNQGIGQGLEYADSIAAIFRNKQFDGITCHSPTVDQGRQVKYETGVFWVTPVLCGFEYEAHFAV